MATHEARREFAAGVVARLRGAGFQALWAGGCVRDLILGQEPSDYDVATDARPERVMGLFRRNVPVGASFGVVRVIGPAGMDVEVATFRTDGEYRDGRRPESVAFADARADAERRDFTINGMFLDPIGGEVLDFVGGRADLDAGIIRAIGDPAARFAEDKLRLFRAARFAARFGFGVEADTRRALEAMVASVRVVAAERIAMELRKMLVHPSRAAGMALAMDLGLIAATLPPVARLPADAWGRTLGVLGHLPDRPGAELAFAALLGEAGGTDPQVARAVAEAVARDLKLSNAEREQLGWLVEHRRALDEPSSLGAARLKRLLTAPGVDDLLALHRAIGLATTGRADHVDFCESYRRDQPDGPISPPPLLSGHDLGRHGFRPGPLFKRYLEAAYDAQLEGRVATREEALSFLDRFDADLRQADQGRPSPG